MASKSEVEVYDYNLPKVIAASSAGTLIEWYDFYIFGSLALILADRFYPPGNETVAFLAFLATLATFATGFLVRPFGAVVFGRIGDLVGRKFTFVLVYPIAVALMTFIIGMFFLRETKDVPIWTRSAGRPRPPSGARPG